MTLTPIQLEILFTAAKRERGNVFPMTIGRARLRGAPQQAVVDALKRKGLIIYDGIYVITDAGRKAVAS